MPATINIDKVYTDSQHPFNPSVCKYSDAQKRQLSHWYLFNINFLVGTVIHYQCVALFNNIHLPGTSLMDRMSLSKSYYLIKRQSITVMHG